MLWGDLRLHYGIVGVMLIQSNPFHMDTEGTMDSVHINGCLSQNYPFYWSGLWHKDGLKKHYVSGLTIFYC